MTSNTTPAWFTPEEEAAIVAHAATFPGLADSAGALTEVPFLDAERARDWYGREVPDTRTFHSTGTSGFPKAIAWSDAEEAWYVGDKQDHFAPWLAQAGVERAFVSLAVGHNANSANVLLGNLGIAVHDAGLAAINLQAHDVAAFDPHLLYASVSILHQLMAELERDHLTLTQVRRVITNGEVLHRSIREDIERTFGLTSDAVMDTYGSTEIGTIAATCPGCGRYHFMPGILPEPVPAEMLPHPDLPDGVGLAVTHVKRTSFPVVRFVTHDVVTGLGRTVCGGRERWGCDAILGRCDDVVNYGELFPAYELGQLLGEHLPGARWFAFNPANDLVLVCEGTEPAGWDAAYAARFPLHHQMAGLAMIPPPRFVFLPEPEFARFVAAAGLPTGSTGKAGQRVHRVFEEAWLKGLSGAEPRA